VGDTVGMVELALPVVVEEENGGGVDVSLDWSHIDQGVGPRRVPEEGIRNPVVAVQMDILGGKEA